MVYLVRKNINGNHYLYVQEVKVVEYIGREEDLTEKELKARLKKHGIPYDNYLKRFGTLRRKK